MLVAAVCCLIFTTLLLAAMFAVWSSGSRRHGRETRVVIRAVSPASHTIERANVFALDEYRMARSTRRASSGGIAS
jgi:hypothetical protein